MSTGNSSEQIRLLSEILKWVKFAGMKDVKEVLSLELNTEPKKQVYQLSDGNRTNAEINKATGVSSGAISGYWKKWVKQGLGEKISVKGGERFIRAFDLEDFGISVPKVNLEKDLGETKNEQPKEELEASK
jgi:hypothetical protein